MKIQCDVCEKAQAAVICCADEAALCVACDVEIHAANKLASKHQRLRLDCLSTKLPRCDICQEKVAFIFCVEDRALFCQDCDESIHVDGTRSANHQRYLATGIRVALSTICNKDSNDNNEPPSEAPAVAVASATKVPATQVISSFMNSAWDVDEFLQLSDHETSHKGSPVGFGELDWFADIDIFHGQMPKGIQTAAQVPELPAPQASNIGVFRTNKFTNSKASNNTGSYRANKYGMVASKKPRLEFMDDEEFFTVPDLG
ncbi:B-box zinc finger protein 24-like isoform X1 [Zingiber officinale]|nr:B-box zinc finger protein 24-like isoform X1 [Zingiber officinale]XP_042391073.1 B-box zinc finger protein 24-like isoform X1 [Zingiber officinale]